MLGLLRWHNNVVYIFIQNRLYSYGSELYKPSIHEFKVQEEKKGHSFEQHPSIRHTYVELDIGYCYKLL